MQFGSRYDDVIRAPVHETASSKGTPWALSPSTWPREADRSRGHSTLLWIGSVAAFVVAVGALTFVLHNATQMNVKDLFVDPTAKAQLGSHVGLFSHLGVLALWTGATVLVGAALLVSHGTGTRFLLTLGGLLAWLALDDLYLIHEGLGGVIARHVLPSIDRRMLEGVVFAAYGVAWVAWLVRFRRTLLNDTSVLLLLALALLGGSVAIDVGEILVENWVQAHVARITAIAVLEELLKLGGILLLASYSFLIARNHARQEMGHS